MSNSVIAWVRINEVQSTSGFYKGIDQERLTIKSWGRLLKPQTNDFIKNEQRYKEDEILTAFISFEHGKQAEIYNLPQEMVDKCIGFCKVQRELTESLNRRKAECFRTDIQVLMDNLSLKSILAHRKEWIKIEPIFHEDSKDVSLDDLKIGESRELFIERVIVSFQYEE